MTRRIAFPLLLALVLAACASPPKAKTYPMQGEIKALNADSKSATIAAGKIGDWMEAMTMEYPVKPDAEFRKLRVGDRIEAKVVVREDKYYVTEVRVVQ
ncbi:MAG: copper-binding protein [Bryobacteraceae bacterium]|jgi:Cu/Ag efflux protein CusF